MSLLSFHPGHTIDLLSLTIVGKRILLTPLARGYARDLFAEFTHEITRYMIPEPVDNIRQMHDYIDTCREKMLSWDELTLVISAIDTGEFLGICALHGGAQRNCPELGIWIKKSVQGKGLGREALQALLIWTGEKLDCDYLTYTVDKENQPSRRLVESLGGLLCKYHCRTLESDLKPGQLVYILPLS